MGVNCRCGTNITNARTLPSQLQSCIVKGSVKLLHQYYQIHSRSNKLDP
uniref:Uncharacterized protein n=1 Tax=Rhizophora mucronata TaxID=61149 RepID=A0A2P2MX86_RHIMU